MDWLQIIGKNVVAFRGCVEEKFGKKIVPLSFILFDDKETYIQLEKQDPYDYHDCSPYARHIKILKNKNTWQLMFDKKGFEEANYFESL